MPNTQINKSFKSPRKAKKKKSPWKDFKKGFKKHVIGQYNWWNIGFLVIVLIMYHAGKLDGKDTMKEIAIQHGCGTADVVIKEDTPPIYNLESFKWK